MIFIFLIFLMYPQEKFLKYLLNDYRVHYLGYKFGDNFLSYLSKFLLQKCQIFGILCLKIIIIKQMGNQQGKPKQGQKQKQQQIKEQKGKKQQKKVAEQKQQRSPRNRKSPQLNKDLSSKEYAEKRKSKQNSALTNHKSTHLQEKPDEVDQQDDNEFMPLLKLGDKGKIKLIISIAQMSTSFDNKKQPYISRSSASYRAKLQFIKSGNNLYQFSLHEDGNYSLNFKADLQGNFISQNQQSITQFEDDLWVTICPVNIPFGKVHRIGQFQCVNIYEEIRKEENNNDSHDIDYDQVRGPSLKNIDLPIDEQVYYKWGQKPPRNNVGQPFDKVEQKANLIQYKQISRYFDMKNNWKGSTFVQQTVNIFRFWTIMVEDSENQSKKLSNQIIADVKSRESQYIKQIYAETKKIRNIQK